MGVRVLMITNDVVTTEDAKHVRRTLNGVLIEERILGVETGACPHTAVREDPSMNLAAVEDMEARFPDSDLVLIESGGDNLTLTFSPALVDFFIYVIDVAAGDKIPRKNGPGISKSDILVINKTDLAPYVGRRPRGHGARRAADARRQAVRVHQLQDRRGHRRAGRAHPAQRALRRRSGRRDHDRWTTRRSWRRTRTNRPSCPARRPGQGRRAAARGSSARGDRTILADLYRQSPLLVQRALYWDEEMPDLPCVFIITTSGGILQGDRLTIDVDAGRRRAGRT